MKVTLHFDRPPTVMKVQRKTLHFQTLIDAGQALRDAAPHEHAIDRARRLRPIGRVAIMGVVISRADAILGDVDERFGLRRARKIDRPGARALARRAQRCGG